MKRVSLVLLVAFVFIFSMNLVFSGDPSQFTTHCTTTGCYIAECGSSPSDISYITNTAGNPQCTWTGKYCEDNKVKNRIDGGTPTNLPGSVHPDCRKPNQWPYFCIYVIDDCNSGRVCIDDGTNPAYCCTPKTCADFFSETDQCGSNFDDGCGGTIDCLTQNNAVCDGDPGQYVCNDGYENCDGDWTDGCESNLNTDNDNCGSCGNACFGDYYCFGGACSGNEWRNLNNVAITRADIEDYVKMYSPYAGSGRHYTIKHGDVTLNGDYAFDYFYIDKDYPDGLTFKVNGVNNDYSDPLTIRTGSDSGGDDGILIEMINPPCGEAYNKGTNLNIQFRVLDEDDMVMGNLTSNGVVLKRFNNLVDGPEVTVPYTLNNPGNVQFKVYANNTRGKKFKAVTNIMVYDSTNSSTQKMVAACIDEPKNFDVFDTQFVDFNASSSRGLIYDDGDFDWVLPDDLYFDWTFVYHGRSQHGTCSEFGRDPCHGDFSPGGKSYLFTKIFPTVDDNYAYLSVSMP